MLIDEPQRWRGLLPVLECEEIAGTMPVSSFEGAVGREVHGAEVFVED